jgi:hypothetical protein
VLAESQTEFGSITFNSTTIHGTQTVKINPAVFFILFGQIDNENITITILSCLTFLVNFYGCLGIKLHIYTFKISLNLYSIEIIHLIKCALCFFLHERNMKGCLYCKIPSPHPGRRKYQLMSIGGKNMDRRIKNNNLRKWRESNLVFGPICSPLEVLFANI